MLGRILILSDAAHSFGASYYGQKTGSLTDVSVFSFHAVKNLTTAEGGAVALNLPEPFDNEEIYKKLCVTTLHGQNKDALAKTQRGSWKYDIVEAGYKCNMTDLSAAIGLIELERYDSDTLVKRKHIATTYNRILEKDDRFELPIFETDSKKSCFHLYPLRIKGITELQRDAIMQEIFEADVSVNVHFIPVPAMSFYKNMGYDVSNYKTTLDNFRREISLPVFYDLTDEQIAIVVNAVVKAVNKVLW
jgi:dTDP-4-amino-4,6-dideoxygalactose transaminase